MGSLLLNQFKDHPTLYYYKESRIAIANVTMSSTLAYTIQTDYKAPKRSNYIDLTTFSWLDIPYMAIRKYFMQSYENIYFLLLSCIQISTHPSIGWLPEDWSPSGPWTTGIPLIACFLLEICSLLYVYIQDTIRSYHYNCIQSARVYRNGTWHTIPCKDIQVGDIMNIHNGTIIPVDVVLWSCENYHRTTHVSYANLNGESDTVTKHALYNELRHIDSCTPLRLSYETVSSKKPASMTVSYKEFSGTLQYVSKLDYQTTLHPINHTHFICGGCIYTGQTPIYVVVVENGKRIRTYSISMSKEANDGIDNINIGVLPQDRHTTLDNYITRILTYLYVPLLVLCCTYVSYKNTLSVQTWIQAWIVFNGIVPLSARLVLMTKRVLQRHAYSNIKNGSVHWNHVTALEELPHVDMVLSDKTGTMTTNQLKIVGYTDYSRMRDMDTLIDRDIITHFIMSIHCSDGCYSTQEDRVMGETIRMGPVKFYIEDDQLWIPDWSSTHCEASVLDQETCTFDCIHKRSSILYTHHRSNRTYIVTKGSIDSIRSLCGTNTHTFSQDVRFVNMEYPYLRTMAIAYRHITEEQLEEYYRIQVDSSTEKTRLREWMESPGTFHYQTILCMEDPLQPDVNPTVQTLAEHGMAVSMCTGDRRETAISIGEQSGIIQDPTNVVDIDDIRPTGKTTAAQSTLIFGSRHLSLAKTNAHYQREFIRYIRECRNFIAYQLTPTDKRTIADMCKKSGRIVMAIGDGNNDIPMFQSARVSIGIDNGLNTNVVQTCDGAIFDFQSLSTVLQQAYYTSNTNYESLYTLCFRVVLIHASMYFWTQYHEFDIHNRLYTFTHMQLFHFVWGLLPAISTVYTYDPQYVYKGFGTVSATYSIRKRLLSYIPILQRTVIAIICAYGFVFLYPSSSSLSIMLCTTITLYAEYISHRHEHWLQTITGMLFLYTAVMIPIWYYKVVKRYN